MAQGPYIIYGKPLFIWSWSTNFEIKEDLLWALPLLVTLPNLSLHLWGKEAFQKSWAPDECTTTKLRVSYARVQVEVDIAQKPREKVCIKDHNDKILEQKIEYEWKPKYCQSCLRIGTTALSKRLSQIRNKWHRRCGNMWLLIQHRILTMKLITNQLRRRKVVLRMREPHMKKPGHWSHQEN